MRPMSALLVGFPQRLYNPACMLCPCDEIILLFATRLVEGMEGGGDFGV